MSLKDLRIKLIGLTIQVRLICENHYLCLCLLGTYAYPYLLNIQQVQKQKEHFVIVLRISPLLTRCHFHSKHQYFHCRNWKNLYGQIHYLHWRHNIKSGTPEYGTMEHRTPAEQRNTGGTLAEHWRNTGTLAEQRNYEGTIWIPWNIEQIS